jgi:hypothetical protein
MAGYQKAVIVDRFGYVNEPFIFELALRKLDLTFGMLEAIVGRYSKGKRKGQLRGKLIWEKCTVGGWVKDGPGYHNGHVCKPNTTFNYKLVDAFTEVPYHWSINNLTTGEVTSK